MGSGSSVATKTGAVVESGAWHDGGFPGSCGGPGVGLRRRLGRGIRSTGALALLLVATLGCVGKTPELVKPDDGRPLAANEGFVIVQIDTTLGIEELWAGRYRIAQNLQVGRHAWIVRMKQGHYRWEELRLLAQSVGTYSIRPKAVVDLKKREFEFDVAAGAINYPGELVLRLADADSGLASGYFLRNRNHAATAVRTLSKTHRALLEAHPIRNAGWSPDGFLDFYTRERDRLRASSGERRGGAGGGR